MASPVKLAHIALKTRDIKASRDWYKTVLQAQIGFENEMFCFMTYDDEHHRVALARDENFEPGGPSVALHHVSFTYDNFDDLFETYGRLAAQDAAEFMESDTLRANPIGIEFDPDDLHERRKSGESVDSLTVYG